MVSEHLKELYEAQTDDLYRSLGKFVVQFEHLVFATKLKIQELCGFGQETALLLEPYSARQTIDKLADLICLQSKEIEISEMDHVLFKHLISDLRSMNTERNHVIHTKWYIGWASEVDTDFSKAVGHKFASQMNSRFREISPQTFEELIKKCEGLYKVMYTTWPIGVIERLRSPSLSSLFSRSPDGVWFRMVA